MGPGKLGVQSGDGPDHHQSQSAGVRGDSRFNARCQGLEDCLVGFKAAVLVLNQQVFTESKDTVVGDEGLFRVSIVLAFLF